MQMQMQMQVPKCRCVCAVDALGPKCAGCAGWLAGWAAGQGTAGQGRAGTNHIWRPHHSCPIQTSIGTARSPIWR